MCALATNIRWFVAHAWPGFNVPASRLGMAWLPAVVPPVPSGMCAHVQTCACMPFWLKGAQRRLTTRERAIGTKSAPMAKNCSLPPSPFGGYGYNPMAAWPAPS